MGGALCCGIKAPPAEMQERELGVYAGFKKNCSQVQILAPWRAWKTLDPQKDKVAC